MSRLPSGEISPHFQIQDSNPGNPHINSHIYRFVSDVLVWRRSPGAEERTGTIFEEEWNWRHDVVECYCVASRTPRWTARRPWRGRLWGGPSTPERRRTSWTTKMKVRSPSRGLVIVFFTFKKKTMEWSYMEATWIRGRPNVWMTFETILLLQRKRKRRKTTIICPPQPADDPRSRGRYTHSVIHLSSIPATDHSSNHQVYS